MQKGARPKIAAIICDLFYSVAQRISPPAFGTFHYRMSNVQRTLLAFPSDLHFVGSVSVNKINVVRNFDGLRRSHPSPCWKYLTKKFAVEFHETSFEHSQCLEMAESSWDRRFYFISLEDSWMKDATLRVITDCANRTSFGDRELQFCDREKGSKVWRK